MSAFQRWLDGEAGVPLRAGWSESAPKKAKKSAKKNRDRQRLDSFLRVYAAAGLALCAVLLAALLIGMAALPRFAEPGNPTDNEVVERYVSSAETETGTENAIAGMILNYRGFDTFGESCVLFLALCCVMLLLWDTDGKRPAEARPAQRQAPRDAILVRVCTLVLPCVLVFGLCVLFNGHVSPGGGFSGGSVLGAALILFSVAFGADSVRRFFTRRVFHLVRITGLLLYAGMFGVYIWQGANFGHSGLARSIVLVIDLAVGLVVMSTMYGFYSFYTKGDL